MYHLIDVASVDVEKVTLSVTAGIRKDIKPVKLSIKTPYY